jgi:hypothetical protein
MVYGAVAIGGVATTSGGVVSTVAPSSASGATGSGSAELAPLDTAPNVPITSSAPAPIDAETNLNCVEFTCDFFRIALW